MCIRDSNKGVTEKDIMGACANAFKNGWSKVKLYFMMGLPTETDEDLAGIASIALRIKDLYHEIRWKYDCRITVSVDVYKRQVEVQPVRVYPFGNAGAQILGYVGEAGPEDVDKNGRPYASSTLIGRAGLE